MYENNFFVVKTQIPVQEVWGQVQCVGFVINNQRMQVIFGDIFDFVNKSHLWTEYKILVGNEDETQIIKDKSGTRDLFAGD